MEQTRASRKEQTLFVFLMITAIVMVGAMLYILRSGTNMVARLGPRIDAVMEIGVEATLGHLWLMEAIPEADHKSLDSAKSHLEVAAGYVEAMLEGGYVHGVWTPPAEHEEIRAQLMEIGYTLAQLDTISGQHLNVIHSPINGDRKAHDHDPFFTDLLRQTAEVEHHMRQVVDSEMSAFEHAQTVLIFTGLGFFILLAVSFYRYLAEEKANRKRIKHLNLVLRAVRNVTQLITREPDRQILIKKTCESLVETRGFHNAWIALVDDGGRPSLWAEAGLAEGFEPAKKILKEGSFTPCCQKALKCEGVVVINDPPAECTDCPLAQKYTGRAGMSVKLEHLGQIYGYMVVSTPQNFADDAEEQELFNELADDIALRLHLINVEEERNRVEDALRASEERYRTLAANIPGSDIFLFDRNLRFVLAEGTEMKKMNRTKEFYEGRKLHETFPAPAAKAMEPCYLKTLSGESATAEITCCDQEYSLHTVPLLNEGDKVAAGLALMVNITERKRDMEALRLAQFSLHYAAEGVFWLDDQTFRIIRVNDAGCRMLGYTAEELCQKHVYDIDPDFFSGSQDEFKRQIQAGNGSMLEAVHRTKDGRMIPVEVTCGLVPFGDKRYICAFVRDITERKRSEEALRLAQFTIDHAAEAIHWIDEDLRIIRVNETACQMLGYTEEELCQLHVYDIDFNMSRQDCQKCRLMSSEEQGYTVETIHIAKDGRKIPVEVTCGHMPYGGQNLVCTFIRDITERKKANEAIVQSEEKYRGLFATMAQGVIYLDREGRITSVNSSAERILGFDRNRMVGTSVMDQKWKVIREDGSEFPAEERPAAMALKTGKPVNGVVMGMFNPTTEAYIWISIDSIPEFRPGEDTPFRVYTTFSDITERRRMEDALRENEEKFRMISEQSLLGIAVIQDNMIKYGNAAAGTIFDLKSDGPLEIPLERVVSMLHEEDRPKVVEQMRRKQLGLPNVDNHYPFRVVSTSGKIKWIEVYSRTVSYEGRPANFATLVDVTDRKRSEMIQAAHLKIAEATNLSPDLHSLLQTIHESLGTLIDTTNFYVALYDPDTETYSFPYCVDEHDGVEFSQEDLKKSLTDYVRRTGRPALINEKAHRELERQGEVSLVGEPSPVWMGVPLKTASGVLGVIVVQSYTNELCYSEDDLNVMTFISGYITMALEKKLAEAALRLSEERFRTMFEQASVGVATISPDGRWLRVNETLCNITGYSREELEQMTFHDITYPEDINISPVKIERIVNGETDSYRVEKRYVRKDGEVVWVNVSASLLGSPQDENACLMTVIQDITERKQAEEMVAQYTDRLLKANRDLQAKQAELEEFIYTVSHDLKAPVVSISGFSGMITEKYSDLLDETGARYLDRIRFNAEVMEELISDLLELSRIDRSDEETAPINFGALTDEVLESFSVAAAGKHIRLTKGDFPGITGRIHRVRQLLTNLVDNAIKYMPTRSDALVEVGYDTEIESPRGSKGAFFVRDNGAGIPAEFHERIFGMFQRVRSNGTQAEGSGVGLAVVKRIAEKHGGEIWVDSEPDRGSTFYFSLPLRSSPYRRIDNGDAQPGQTAPVTKETR